MEHNLPFTVTFLEGASLKREEEALESLQAIALQRAICISDDPATLLHATANIFAIRRPVEMKQLWDEPTFRQRFLDLLHDSKNGIMQLRGYNVNSKDIAVSARCLYSSAAAHIALTLDSDVGDGIDLLKYIWKFEAPTIFIPVRLVHNSSSSLIKASMGIFPLWSTVRTAPDSVIDIVHSHLAACSGALASYSDFRFLFFFSWVVFRFPRAGRISLASDSLGQMRQSYRGSVINDLT